jgi:hypothetical protein
MTDIGNKKRNTDNSQLWKYGGMAMQFFAAIGITVFLGLKLDHLIGKSIPVWAWLLPLLAITGIIIKVFRETAGKK